MFNKLKNSTTIYSANYTILSAKAYQVCSSDFLSTRRIEGRFWDCEVQSSQSVEISSQRRDRAEIQKIIFGPTMLP